VVEVIRLKAGELPCGAAIARAGLAARQGQVVAFPTDTVYGLGTSASSREGVERLCRMKGRSPDKPLPLLAASADALRRWVQWPPRAEALARRFWPGGLTMVLKATAEGRSLACCRGETLAVRVPDHPVALALLRDADAPWAQTSANASGEPPLPDGAAVARRFGEELALVLDSGPAPSRHSTIVDATQAPVRVLREGAVPPSEIFAVLAPPRRLLFVCAGNSCRSVMAESLLNKLAADRGLDLSTRSCGLAADPAFPIPAGVRRALAAEGVAALEHVPQPVTRELMDWADQVLVMERRHRELLLGLFPDAAAKIGTLAGNKDVADPVGQPDAVYADCCRTIKTALETVLGRAQEEPENAPRA
jgi:tRNA threonylcarbamoyl adenosine modification protein (Sua5/YciO/YrdC/YwlC family)